MSNQTIPTTAALRLTVAAGHAAGKAIMADARCDEAAKKAVRRGLTKDGELYMYHQDGGTWYDAIMREHATEYAVGSQWVAL